MLRSLRPGPHGSLASTVTHWTILLDSRIVLWGKKFLRAGFLKLARSWYIMDCGATSASCQKINDVHKKDDQCKHAKLSYCLGAVIIHLISIKTTKHVYMRSNFSLRNSSTLSVFHLRMLSSSAMFPLSSKSFSTGSEPRTYYKDQR